MAGIELTTVGDVCFRFDYRTSELVVEAYECEIGRVKINDLLLAYDRKVCHILRTPAEIMMRHHPIEKASNVLPMLKDMLDKFSARLLMQRERSRDDGDKLAVAAQFFLDFKGKKGEPVVATAAQAREHLVEAIATYCESQGWNGPAGRWAVNKVQNHVDH